MFLNNQELETIMSHYDLKHDGTITYEEFLAGMKGSLNARRKMLVGTLFNQIGGGAPISLEVRISLVPIPTLSTPLLPAMPSFLTKISLLSQQVMNAFNPDGHPQVLDGIATRDEVGKQFMEIFDPSMSNGVQLADFESAFSEISAVTFPHP